MSTLKEHPGWIPSRAVAVEEEEDPAEDPEEGGDANDDTGNRPAR